MLECIDKLKVVLSINKLNALTEFKFVTECPDNESSVWKASFQVTTLPGSFRYFFTTKRSN